MLINLYTNTKWNHENKIMQEMSRRKNNSWNGFTMQVLLILYSIDKQSCVKCTDCTDDEVQLIGLIKANNSEYK